MQSKAQNKEVDTTVASRNPESEQCNPKCSEQRSFDSSANKHHNSSVATALLQHNKCDSTLCDPHVGHTE